MLDLASQLGPIDIYLLDQLLRGRIAPGMRILDAGCGDGRNLVWFLREGYEVCGVEADGAAIEAVRSLAGRLAPRLSSENFRHEPIQAATFPEAHADVVICNAVLHFARSGEEFEAMLRGCWRVLKPGGLFFCRLASSIGIEAQIEPIEGRRFRLPDRSERYLVDEPLLLDWSATLEGDFLDPLKTTVVQGRRAMTTWVLRRCHPG